MKKANLENKWGTQNNIAKLLHNNEKKKELLKNTYF